MPCTPRYSNTMSHTALRCRCRPSGPGGTCWVQAASGCLAARVTRSRGGVSVGVAQLVAGRHGHHHLARRMPRGGAGLAASRTSKALRPSLRTLPASLGVRPPPVPAGWSPPGPSGGSACSSGNRGRGLYLRLVWCRISGDQAVNGTCRCGEVCKAQIEKGGVDMRQFKNKRSKLDEIHINSYENRTNFVPISHFQNIHTNLFT